jgi:hypothetical protein
MKKNQWKLNSYAQQGDVLIKKVSDIKGKKLNHLTLAQGESSGHHHTITKGEAELYEHEGTLFLRVNSAEAILTHQEHNTIVIPKGDYEIGIVKEFDHLSEEVKNVKD